MGQLKQQSDSSPAHWHAHTNSHSTAARSLSQTQIKCVSLLVCTNNGLPKKKTKKKTNYCGTRTDTVGRLRGREKKKGKEEREKQMSGIPPERNLLLITKGGTRMV